jgi:hypothetical protein
MAPIAAHHAISELQAITSFSSEFEPESGHPCF